MLSNNQMKKAVVSTFLITSLIWGFPSVSLYLQSEQRNEEISQLKSDISLLSDRDTIQIARKVKNSDYSYEEYITGYSDQISELEASIDGKDSEIDLLERQVESIKKSYKRKLRISEVKKYNLESNILTDTQLKRADQIAYIVAVNYEKYGVLPSVAVGQAMQETQLGVAITSATPNYGWWGVCSDYGYATYSTLEEGIYSYLECINNGLYDGALFERDPFNSLMSIQKGGYCQPSDGYASAVISCIESYGFAEYDDYYLGSAENEQSNETRNGKAE